MRNSERARGTGTMAPTSTSVDGLETVETRNYTISRAPQARRRCAGSRENGGQLRWTVAPRENSSAEHRSVQSSLRLARVSRAHGSWLVRPAEPPDADPHVRSCGMGERVTTPPMPIVFPTRPSPQIDTKCCSIRRTDANGLLRAIKGSLPAILKNKAN
jgi:hypothetical protein